MHRRYRSSLKALLAVVLFLFTVIVSTQLSAQPASSLLPGVQPKALWQRGWEVVTMGLPHAPTDFEIMATSRLPQPLVPVNGKTTQKENRELVATLTAFYSQKDSAAVNLLTHYVTDHPHSPWKVSLLANLGAIYFNSGYPSKALAAFGQAWELGKDATDEKSRMIVDYALGEYALMNGRLGRFQELDALFKRTQGRELVGPGTVLMKGAREGRSMMQQHPGIAFRCGPFAVETIARVQKTKLGKLLPESERLMSTEQGTSLAQLAKYAPKLGLQLKMVKRAPGAPIILPAVMHWKVGHFSALTQQEGDKYLSEDPTFRQNIWLDALAIDAETTGYALVPSDVHLPKGWQEINRKEAQQVWGKGYVYGSDPTNTGPGCPKVHCQQGQGGMASYNFQPQLVNLNIEDTPLEYIPGYGPAMVFTIDYNQHEYGQPTTFTYANLGPKWTHNWTAYVVDQPGNPNASVVVYYRGGGSEQYSQDTSVTTGWQSLPSQRTNAVLKRSGNQYELDYPDGSKEIYAQTNGGTTTARQIFLKQVVNRYGNAATLNYGQGAYLLRLMSVTDATGAGSLNFSYRSDDPFKIASVTAKATASDPGRTAKFNYTTDSSGVLRLVSSTDPLGIVSSFAYTGDFINALTTPYGTTTFTTGNLSSTSGYNATGFDYYLQAQDPLGQKERVEFRDDIGGLAYQDAQLSSIISTSTPIPSGMVATTSYRNYRNSFYWNQQQMSQFTGISVNGTIQAAPSDLDIAQWYHWLHGFSYADVGQGGNYVTASIPEETKAPLSGWVSYYYGQGNPLILYPNNLARLVEVGRVLDDGSSQVSHLRYNQKGNITCYQDPAGRITLNTYTPDGVDVTGVYQVKTTGQNCDSFNGTDQTLLASYTYFPQGDPLSGKHLVQTATDAAGNATTYAYDSHGRVTQVTDAIGEVTRFSYDNATGKLASIQKANSTLVSLTYDSTGRVQTTTDSSNYTLGFGYDDLNRLISKTYPDGSSQQLKYTALDVSLFADRDRSLTRYSYNANRQLVSSTDANNHTTQYLWSADGALESIVDPRGFKTSWTYDLESRPIAKTYPDGGTETYGYETTTNRQKLYKDPKGQVTNYSYNVDNSLNQIAYADSTQVNLAYDPVFPRPVSMTDSTGTTTYTYDSAQRLVSVDGPLSGNIDQVTYTYDALNRVASESVAGATQESAIYDALGRITSETTSLGQFTYSYDGASPRLTQLSYPNGQKTSFSYYGASTDFLPKTLQNLTAKGTNLSSWSFTNYDAQRNLTGLKEHFHTSPPTTYSYSYDPTGQLTSAMRGARTLDDDDDEFDGHDKDDAKNQSDSEATQALNDSYVYDPNGNPTTFSDSGHASSHAYNASNQLTDSGYTYDANGNLTSNGIQTFAWDAANRLVTITQGNQATKIAYDGLGRFVRITDTGTATSSDVRYLWDGDQIVAQLDANGTTVLKRYLANGVQVGTTNSYYTQDVLGSIRELTDQTGTLQARFDYGPFGSMKTLRGSGTADFGFAGYFYHAPSGLNLTRYRAYSPKIGRFLSRDPIGEVGGLNLYAYTGNNPVNRTDSSGLQFSLSTLGSASLLAGVNTLPDFSCHQVPKWLQDIGFNLGIVAITEGFGEIPFALEGAEEVLSSGTTPLYRAVMDPELEGIEILQEFENPPGMGGGVKYFSTTPEGSASYAKQAYMGFGDGPFTLIKTEIPTNLITENMIVPGGVDRGINTVVIGTELLPQLAKPEILDTMPIPELP